MTHLFLVLSTLLGFSLPLTAVANQVTVAADRDNTMFSEDGTLSNGSGDYMFAGRTDDGDLRRALVRFDVAGAIPSGSTINTVTLRLFMSRTKARDVTVTLHSVNSDWGEGTSHAGGEEGKGATATADDATWTHAFWSGTIWNSAGGDYGAASASAVVKKTEAFYEWSSPAMATDVQAWLDDPATNFGWALAGNEAENKTAKRFDTHDSTESSRRPELIVDFTPPASTGACCAPDGTCSEVNHPPASCSDYQGQGTTCQTTSCPQPTGACCVPDAAATCVEVQESDCLAQSGTWSGGLTTCTQVDCPVVLTPFVDPLPLPAVATPTSGTSGGAANYTMAIVEFDQQLHRDLPPTRVWGFDDGTGGAFPGPTLETSTDTPITVTWKNDLRDTSGALRQSHMLSVDTCAHGADDQTPRTVVHLHGGHVPAAVDGYPESTFLPGEEVVYDYPNDQNAATLWYHDHALGITRLNVYMGLAGFYLVRDPVEHALGLPVGDYEVPLVIQDREFDPDGALVYPDQWVEHYFGNTILVNGKAWPFFDVDQGKYRFRILNGSNSRTYTLALSDGSSFKVIGSDGGLLTAPVSLTSLTISPGERYDVIMDFEGYSAGTEVTLENSAPAPYPGSAGVGVIPNVMKFIVGADPGHTDAIPNTLRSTTTLDPANAAENRDFELSKFSDPCSDPVWLINGLGWDDITEYPTLGTTEVWRFINRSGTSHPMHMHLVFFKVLDRQQFDEVGGVVTPIGTPSPPSLEEAGWKDTVEVGPDEIVRVIARFEDYTGKYAYHCHILEHEDHEMMRQFEAVTECGDGHRGMPDEECDDGNLVDGDGCDSNCTITGCGNGIVDSTEECEDGNDVDGDGCDTNCTLTACGNGIVTDGEACDDGNTTEGDGCDTNCTVSACGNGIADPSEECDDGNDVAGDGCEPDCSVTSPEMDMGRDMGPDSGVPDVGREDVGPGDDGGSTDEDMGPGDDAGGTGDDVGYAGGTPDAGGASDMGTDAPSGSKPGVDEGCCRVVEARPSGPATPWLLILGGSLLWGRRRRVGGRGGGR